MEMNEENYVLRFAIYDFKNQQRAEWARRGAVQIINHQS